MIFGRYRNASARCADWISSLPAKSAMDPAVKSQIDVPHDSGKIVHFMEHC